MGLSGRLIASYILVTLAVVVLVEALVLGFQVPQLVNSTQLQAQVDAAARSYGQQFAQRYPRGTPAGTVLGVPGHRAQPGLARPAADGSLAVPAITGPVHSDQAVTAAVAIAADGTGVASSAPSRYPPGRAAASEPPAPAISAIEAGATHMIIKCCFASTPYGSVLWTVEPAGRAGISTPPASAPGRVAYVYVQAPWSAGFSYAIHAWGERLAGPLHSPYAVLLAIVPVGVLFGIWPHAASSAGYAAWNEPPSRSPTATTPSPCPSPAGTRVGRLEANFTAMTCQLGSGSAGVAGRAGDGCCPAGGARAIPLPPPPPRPPPAARPPGGGKPSRSRPATCL